MIFYLFGLFNAIAGCYYVINGQIESAIFFFILFTWCNQEINHKELKEKLDKMFNL